MDSSKASKFMNNVGDLLQNGQLKEVVSEDISLLLLDKGDIERFKWWPPGLGCRLPFIIASSAQQGGVLSLAEISVLDNNAEINEEVFSSSISPKPKQKPKTLSGADLIGSPLKLQTFADLSMFNSPKQSNGSVTCTFSKLSTKNTNVGLTLSKARQLISTFATSSKNLLANVNKEKVPSFLVLCDGSDFKRTACMYIEPVFSEEELIGNRIANITVKDPADDSFDLAMTAIDHLMNNVSGNDVECEAIYSVVETDKRRVHTEYQGSLWIEVKWNKLTKQLQPPLEARATVKACVCSGDSRSAAYKLYEQFTLVKSLVTGLKTAEMEWMVEKNEVPVIESLKELLEHLKLGDAGSVVQKDEQDNDDEFQAVLDTLVFDDRKDLDFTDNLWSVLMRCTSHAELLECLNHVFIILGRGKLHPMVNRKNQIIMAQLVRDSYIGKMRFPNLSGLYALQILAEMGAEKLLRDYIFIFLSKGLVTLAHLEPFLSTSDDLEERVKNLEKLHLVLEMVVMLRLFLNLPTVNLGSCARSMLKYFEQNEVTKDDSFSFVVPTNTVQHIFEACQPWSIKAEVSKPVHAQNAKETSVHLLTTKLPFKHLPIREDGVLEPEKEDQNKMYFYVKKQESVAILV